MGRLRFFGQEEVDIQLRTERGSSPPRLVPWWACAASGKHSVGSRSQRLGQTGRVGRFRICFKRLQIAGDKPVNFPRLAPQPLGNRGENCEASQKQEPLELLNGETTGEAP